MKNLEALVEATEQVLGAATDAVATATQQASIASTQASNALTSALNAAQAASGLDTVANNTKAYRDAAEGFKNAAQQAQAAADASNVSATQAVGSVLAARDVAVATVTTVTTARDVTLAARDQAQTYASAYGNSLRGDATVSYSALMRSNFLRNQGLNATGATSFRNRIINGNFAINQRAVVTASTSYAAGAYGLDRWKAGAGGVTFSQAPATNGDNTLTLTAGTLVQVIEGGLYVPEGGTFVLSWAGSATARVYQGSASGAYAASPIVVNGLTAGTNVTIEFATGSIGFVQFEPGDTPSSFERRDDEYRRCMRYFEKATVSLIAGGFTNWYFGCPVLFRVQKRAVPNLSWSNISNIAASNSNVDSATIDSLRVYATLVSDSSNAQTTGTFTASAEL